MANQIYSPQFEGTYSIPSATIYICATMGNGTKFQLNTRHLYRWTKEGLAGGYLAGTRNRHLFINFKDLVSLRIVTALRANGIEPKEIAVAESELRKMFGWDYPFARLELWTARPDIFIQIKGIFLSASRHMQAAMDFFEEYLQPVHGLTFDLFGLSSSWEPQQGILLNPQVQFGESCIQGTRVPTQVVWSLYKAGDSLDELALMYGLSQSQLEGAIAWEERLQRAVTSS